MKKKHSKRLVYSAAIALWLGLVSNAAQAQLQSQDVGGFALGQTVGEVESTLKARYPQYDSVRAYLPGPDGRASTIIGSMVMGTKAPASRPLTAFEPNRADLFTVEFSRLDGKVMYIGRQVYNPKGIAVAELSKALEAKYGPNDPRTQGRVYARSSTDALVCAPSTNSFTRTGSTKADAQCGPSISVGWRDPMQAAIDPARPVFDPSAPAVYQRYEVALLDQARYRAHQQANRIDARAAHDAASKRVRDAAAKPSL